MSLNVERHLVCNGEGWNLPLKRITSPAHLNPNFAPLLLLPGYGMNAYIFGWPEKGPSMERCLAEAGFEVWSGGLRGQGNARKSHKRALPPGLRPFSEIDLPRLLQGILQRTTSRKPTVDVVGASLGGAVVFGHLALSTHSLIGNVVALGAPLRWEATHPAMSVLFRSRRLAKLLPMAGSDRMAKAMFPLIGRVAPKALGIYVNPSHVDLSDVGEITRTVDPPHRQVNGDIAHWVRNIDMVLKSTNVTTAMGQQQQPLLVIHANADGIVPGPTATSIGRAWGGDDITVIEVGTPEDWYAHADLFIAPEAPEKVFKPMAEWLSARN